VVWAYDHDEDAKHIGVKSEVNRRLRVSLANNPERYVKIPGLSHGKQHEVLKEFLSSAWSDDKGEREDALAAYKSSIGGWKRSIGDSARIAYECYREERLTEIAKAFLRARGIEPLWH
jgi:hypothetical protein